MNFELSEDQQLLIDTVVSFLKKQSPVRRARELRKDAVGWQKDVWRQMGELGWLAAAFPESVGGMGGTMVDAALIVEQLGTQLVPEPFIPSLVAATAILAAEADDKRRQRWIAPMLEGRTSLALAHEEAQARYDATDIQTRLDEGGAGTWRLSGAKRWVDNGHAADQLVVSARRGEGRVLCVVDREMKGMKVEPVQTIDGRRAAMISFDGAPVENERILGQSADRALAEALDVGAALVCAEGAGVARRVLEMTVDYLKTREQFGVKIGSFQALQHRAVDMFVEAELCRSASIGSTLRLLDRSIADRQSAVSAAKVQLATGGRLITQQAIQLHGGIGITDEHDLGLYFKRMYVLNTLYGDEEHHVARFASLPTFDEGLTAAAKS
jgi:alkylation response protein AidB-like acyl-CoA dehydrogenase